MRTDRGTFTLSIRSFGPSPERDETHLQGLVSDLRAVPATSVRSEMLKPTPPPDGAKGIGSELALVVVGAAPAFPLVAAVVRHWFERQKARTLTLTMDGDTLHIEGASQEDQSAALAAFVERHVLQPPKPSEE